MSPQEALSPFNLQPDLPATKALSYQIHVFLYAALLLSSFLMLAQRYKKGCGIPELGKQCSLIKRIIRQATWILTRILWLFPEPALAQEQQMKHFINIKKGNRYVISGFAIVITRGGNCRPGFTLSKLQFPLYMLCAIAVFS